MSAFYHQSSGGKIVEVLRIVSKPLLDTHGCPVITHLSRARPRKFERIAAFLGGVACTEWCRNLVFPATEKLTVR